VKKYHPDVVIIWNEKSYANTATTIWWLKQMFAGATAFPLSDKEPRFLSLDAFAPHKNKGQKKSGKPESDKKRLEQEVQEKLQKELKDEMAKLNITISIIPGGCTGYVQVLDVAVNKIMKQYIEEAEELHIEQNIEKWKSGKYSVGDCRVLMTHWVGEAWIKLHQEHKETIVKTFRSIGLSLDPNGSQDSELKIQGLPNLVVGDYERAPATAS
jgi:gluconate kinase